jgi:dTDP-4-dehydrorhamnose 3,5-epimerase
LIFRETPLAGAFVLESERFPDERGFFARTFCQQEFEANGLSPAVAQCNLSYNAKKGTLRGLHFQAAPHGEEKLVRVTRGAIFDVIVDLRPASPTFRRHLVVELTAENRWALYVPRDFAHGFQTLEDDTEVFYQMSQFFDPAAARGYRYDDPTFSIPWPFPPTVVSERDLALPTMEPLS